MSSLVKLLRSARPGIERPQWAGCSLHREGDFPVRKVDALDLPKAASFMPSMNDLSTHSLDELTIDESSRPKAPKAPAATDMHCRQGRQLAVIHRHYLMEMPQIEAVLARIEAAGGGMLRGRTLPFWL